MSIVTSIIIIFPYSENEHERIMEINKFEHLGRKFNFCWIDDPNNAYHYSGNKKFNSVVLLGSFSNFPTNIFLDYFSRMIKWEDPKCVQLMINDENSNDRTFSIYTNHSLLPIVPSIKW